MDPEGTHSGGGVTSFDDSSEPLLKKSPSLEERGSNGGQGTAGPASSQQYYPSSRYFYGPRPYRDIAFTVIFVIFILASIALGIFSIVNHNSDYGLVGSALYNSSSGYCYTSSGYESVSWAAKNHSQERSREEVTVFDERNSRKQSPLYALNLGLQQMLSHTGLLKATSGGSFVMDLVWTLVITLVLSVPFIFGILWLLKAYAKQLVYACLPFFILIPVFLNIFWFVACTVTSECREAFNLPARIALFIFVFLLCGIFAWIIYSNWDRVELTIRIMQTAAEALLKNMGLLLVLPSLTIGLLIYVVPFVVFLIFAYMNGSIVASSESSCVGEAATDCCVWEVDKWVPAYYVLAILTVLWSALVMAEVQVYTISGTIAQWYFAAAGSRVTGSIRHSLKSAFGPSFGTVCFSGLVLSCVRIIRAAVDSAQNPHAQQGCFYAVLRCCMNWVMFAIEFLNKFTINFAAITGESYCASARMSYDLLRRNLLSPVFVETISTRLLGGMVFVLSVVYGIVVCAILRSATQLGGDAYIVTVIAWFLLFAILILFSQILDNVIDTVYVCYAVDKDSGAVSKAEVHDVYLLLPVSRDQPATLAVHQP